MNKFIDIKNIIFEAYNIEPYLFEDMYLLSLFQGVGAFERSLDILYSEINL